ncbi:MAG: hypothetical protein WBQ73_03895, partial [Candidatus Babeliales bacterium]
MLEKRELFYGVYFVLCMMVVVNALTSDVSYQSSLVKIGESFIGKMKDGGSSVGHSISELSTPTKYLIGGVAAAGTIYFVREGVRCYLITIKKEVVIQKLTEIMDECSDYTKKIVIANEGGEKSVLVNLKRRGLCNKTMILNQSDKNVTRGENCFDSINIKTSDIDLFKINLDKKNKQEVFRRQHGVQIQQERKKMGGADSAIGDANKQFFDWISTDCYYCWSEGDDQLLYDKKVQFLKSKSVPLRGQDDEVPFFTVNVPSYFLNALSIDREKKDAILRVLLTAFCDGIE